jgi:prepilin-type N-terminal cleavage/methylation domain-containing protein
MKTNRPAEQGFTLVEILVCILVAGVIIGSLSQVVNSYTSISQGGRYLNSANSYAEAKIEELRNKGYNSLSNGTTSLTSDLPTQLPRSRSASITITTPTAGLKKLDLTVSYKSEGKTNTFSYTTYMGELGVAQ